MCSCPCEGSPTTTVDPNQPSESSDPDPCLRDDKPWYCPPEPTEPGTEPPEEPFTDPCAGPEPPWYCNPTENGPPPPTVQAYTDPETGFTYAQYDAQYALDDRRIFYRVAFPDTASAAKGYDAVIQIQAPNDVGWAALAWGGTMVYNPLTVGWANCSTVVVSSRFSE
jgi:hypothetical protein